MLTHKKIIQSSNNTNIYILKLENNKYYVGKSNDLEIRAKAHINGTASAWTKKYKPISVEQVIPNESPYDEDKYTIEYMGKYGIDNVRGGIYVSEALDNTQRNDINKRIWGANDCCTQCGRKGHFVKNCKDLYTQCMKTGDPSSPISKDTLKECCEKYNSISIDSSNFDKPILQEQKNNIICSLNLIKNIGAKCTDLCQTNDDCKAYSIGKSPTGEIMSCNLYSSISPNPQNVGSKTTTEYYIKK